MNNAHTLIEIFIGQAKLSADKLALKQGEAELTYRELDERSDKLAGYLAARGVTLETLVPICVSRPIDMVVGIWGILKAGGAYVPIDPEYPADRISYMLSDTGAQVVISDRECLRFLEAAEGKNVIMADDGWAIINNTPATRPNVKVGPDNLAYVIYTSGSTGKPKGVLVEHGSVALHLEGSFRALPYGNCSSFILGVSFSADTVITQLFGSVKAGAALHLLSKTDYGDVEFLHRYFHTHNIDCLKAVPSHWKSMSLNGAELLPRKILMWGGEALNTALISDVIPTSARSCILVNHYGPTETTVGQLMHIVDENRAYGNTIPIGKSYAGAFLYILNSEGEKVAQGEVGELYIGGACVARGYLNRPELTEQRFLKDRFSSSANARMYRTGDLVRELPDGEIEFIERIDDQVKIRGYRIELGEIENVLQNAPGVKQCVVLAQEGGMGEKRLVAYVVCPGGYDKKAITAYLQQKLPDFMVPQILVPMDKFPYLLHGKVDRKALPNPDASGLLSNAYIEPAGKTEKLLSDTWKEILGVSRAGAEDNFFELGGSSLLAQKMVAVLKNRHGLPLPVVKLYQFPRIKELAEFLDGKTVTRKSARATKAASADVAVISMSGRFPGADSIEELWDVLKNGRETTTFFTDDTLDPSVPANMRNNPDYVKARGVVRDIKGFDAAFFGINPKQAELMDPQQRVFLEIAWEALERGGYVPGKYEGRIGVFAGVRFNTYFANNVMSNEELVENIGRFQVITLNDKDYVASRTSYTLDLKGPAVNVQSACSTSLLAIAQAVQAIRSGQCEMALAGGATLNAPPNVGHLYEEGAMLSNDGHCRPFDAAARGTVFSDGAGVVLLKNMDEAIKDGDTILAVVKGIGVSNDGGGKGSFTAPSAEGQAAAISMAIDDAGVSSADISYIESHGTATPLGDPIEIEGLNIAFGLQDKKQYCAIGSVKSNFGHLTTAAGVTGFIKAVLALHKQQIPPSINYTTPNPHIDFANSPFFVNDKLNNWQTSKTRIAGVSSFGVGGTNVHVVLSEYAQQPAVSGPSRKAQLYCWSAKAEASLDMYGQKLGAFVKELNEAELADTAYTLHTAREQFAHRRFAVATGATDLVEQLGNKAATPTKQLKGKPRHIIFMFPGQGDQYVNMCRSLYEQEAVFRQAMDECAELLQAELKENILNVIYPAVVTPGAEEKIKNTGYSQPALFCIGYALGKLWMSWGIYPTAFIGHSIGEFVAAYFSGVFDLRSAVKLIATRGRMMAGLQRGSMLSVRLSQADVQQYLSKEVDLAAANSPQLSVLAGNDKAMQELSDRLTAQNIPNRLLATSHAFHSYMMDEVVAPFENVVAAMQLKEPVIPIMSTVTGQWMKAADATDAHYWAKHLRSTVYFGNAIQSLLNDGYDTFLELGPGKSVGTLARQQAAGKQVTVISSVEKTETEQPSHVGILKALGNLWLNGVQPDWQAFYKNEQRNRALIPTYAFNRQPYWVDPPMRSISGPSLQAMPLMMPAITQTNIQQPNQTTIMARKPQLVNRIKEIIEDAFGVDVQGASPETTFIELGLDSLLLTQFALTIKNKFGVPVTFRQLNEDLGTLDLLSAHLDAQLPPDAAQPQPQSQPMQVAQAAPQAISYMPAQAMPGNVTALDLIVQQIQLLAAQVSLLQQGGQAMPAMPQVQYNAAPPQPVAQKPATATNGELSKEEEIEIKKPFGAAARIEKHSAALTASQQQYLDELTKRYTAKTKSSKDYTVKHRPHMADPRVVSGFRPATKEMVYNVVINRSKGSRMWDLDGNEYIDALNGFGANMLGYQPDFIKNALIDQIEKGYEIGPQHELAGEVCQLICEFTNTDRSALCNTGSEAVLGAMRIARTVTGRSIIVAFAGSYHGIADEVIVRGSKKLKTYPGSPGIMPEAVQNMLILDYGTDESLRIIEERAHELAAVLVEPIQSRRSEFLPVEFLKKVRAITKKSGTALIFDEVISGFRFNQGGAQAIFGIKADLGTYGKVVGGGMSIGVIAGDRKFMDALDGGLWEYGDDSVPVVGVTYFAGTFVRHPLALAAAKASLLYMKQQGPALQEGLNAKGRYVAKTLNALCRRMKVPMFVANFGSVWRIRFIQDYPYVELFFILMRLKGIHILEGFPCYVTAAHTDEDLQTIIRCFEESLTELRGEGLIPVYEHPDSEETVDINEPPVLGARLGKDKDGNPAWFVADEANPGKYLQVVHSI